MLALKIYLDNCCFNRPFDDPSQIRIRLEAEAKLYLQHLVTEGRLELVWSYMLAYENRANPFEERRRVVETWKQRAVADQEETPQVVALARELTATRGLRSKDSLHVACAVAAGCFWFVSTDDALLRKLMGFAPITAVNPIGLVYTLEEDEQ